MRRRAAMLLFAAVALLSGPSPARADERYGPGLRFDPFARPDLSGKPGGEVTPGPAPAWAPILNATLVAGERSMVNLGGTILKPGDDTHGYRLLAVRRWDALFAKDGEVVVLRIDPEEGP